jgi:hypothetical protein
LNPYKEIKINNSILREFNKETDSKELVWHRDRNDRDVRVLAGEGWHIQFENCLPRKMKVGDYINIEALTYHRILKEDECTNLVLEIKEN